MKKSLIITAALCAGLLVGCAPKATTNTKLSSHSATSKRSDSSVKSTSTTSSSQPSSSSQSSVATTPWNKAKDAALASFMSTWGQSLGQQYESYAPGHSVNFYGVQAPDGFDEMRPAMNDQLLNYEWTTTGETNTDYGIVAIYSDALHAPDLNQHLYLFTINHGQPLVLVTQQNQGNPNNWLYFRPTQNTALQNGFANIVNAK